MINSDNLCMSCMQDIGNEKQCPYCGFHSESQQIAPYLPIRTVVGNRYLIGKLLDYNGDGATYIGLDLTRRVTVNIREYFPEGIAFRDSKSLFVAVESSNETTFMDCGQSFLELWRKLIKLNGLSALINVTDIIEDFGTCYAIYDHVGGMPLREYLLRGSTGYISWEKAQPLLMPVLSTLGTLHSSGIIHKGISPTTLIVCPDGKLKISGFSIGQARAARSELKPQLYGGYAAYEQYSSENPQGTWTDIYAFGAVLYRTLIGSDPIDAADRAQNDRLIVPGKFAEQLPAYVINALVNALQILPEDRTRTVEQLRAEISASPSAAAGSAAAMAPAPEAPVNNRPVRIHEEEIKDDDEPEEKKSGKGATAIALIASFFIGLIIFVVVIFSVPSLREKVTDMIGFGTTTSTSVAQVDVPNFIGYDYDYISTGPYYIRDFTFEKVEEYNEAEEGSIFKQSPEVGTKVDKGDKITLYVSKGTEKIVFPSNIKGRNYDDAKKELEALGFVVKKEDKLNDGTDPTAIANIIFYASLEGGTQHNKGETVTLIVWGEQQTTTTTTSIQSSEDDTTSTEAN